MRIAVNIDEAMVPASAMVCNRGSSAVFGAIRLILMATLAMIFGMLPMAIGAGNGGDLNAPMARAVIGGVITSTLLTRWCRCSTPLDVIEQVQVAGVGKAPGNVRATLVPGYGWLMPVIWLLVDVLKRTSRKHQRCRQRSSRERLPHELPACHIAKAGTFPLF